MNKGRHRACVYSDSITRTVCKMCKTLRPVYVQSLLAADNAISFKRTTLPCDATQLHHVLHTIRQLDWCTYKQYTKVRTCLGSRSAAPPSPAGLCPPAAAQCRAVHRMAAALCIRTHPRRRTNIVQVHWQRRNWSQNYPRKGAGMLAVPIGAHEQRRPGQ